MDSVNPSHDNPLLLSVEAAASVAPRSVDRGGPSVQHTHVVRLDSGFAQPSSPAAHAGSPLRWMLTVFFRRWRLMGWTALIVLILSVVAAILLPPHYRSEAKLLVRLGRESVSIDPTASIGQSAVPMEGRDKEINSEIELLKGRQLLEIAINKVGANRLLSLSENKPETAETLGKAVTLVEAKLAIEAVPDSNVLSIQFEARDPVVARDLISNLIDAYMAARSAIYRGEGNLHFFEDQLASARQEQAAIDKQIQDLRDSSGVSDPTSQRTSLLKRIDDLQQSIDKTQSDHDAEAASSAAIRNEGGSVNLQHERLTLVARQSMQESLIRSLAADKSQAQEQIKHVNDIDVQMAKLQQEATLSAARVTQYAKAYEQARIDQAMGEQRLSNISVAEPPVLPLTPKAPTRGLLLLAGLFVSLTLGLGSGLVAESLDHTVRTIGDLSDLGLKQSVSIPALKDLRSQTTGVKKTGIVATNGKSAHQPTNIVGMPIRPAGMVQLSPELLEHTEAILERIIQTGSDAASPRWIGVIGARPRQGVSTIALHLAAGLSQLLQVTSDCAEDEDRVLLVDADLASCRASELAGLSHSPSFDPASDSAGAGHALNENSICHDPRLDVLTAGFRPLQRRLLAAQLPMALQTISQKYRHVVIDLPAMSGKESSARLAALCGSVVLVCNAGEVNRESVRQTLARLRHAGANVTVAVLNQRRYPIPEWLYNRT